MPEGLHRFDSPDWPQRTLKWAPQEVVILLRSKMTDCLERKEEEKCNSCNYSFTSLGFTSFLTYVLRRAEWLVFKMEN